VTTPVARKAGFCALSLEKQRRLAPLLDQARVLRVLASRASCASELLQFRDIGHALLVTAGWYRKKTPSAAEKREALLSLVKKHLEPAGADFAEVLANRFLRIQKKALRSSMRDLGGFMAQTKLTRSIVACLRVAGTSYQWCHAQTKAWVEMPEDATEMELHVRGLCWETPEGPRTLVYNLTVPFFKNNVDLCLFDCAPKELTREVMRTPSVYLALGELKGGIDPAGADEHWKTARTALSRIHEAFSKHKLKPHTFFIGAAIESKMASEIWDMLNRGVLENAANLTNEDQMASITRWLCRL
jgi:hypothetical protein